MAYKDICISVLPNWSIREMVPNVTPTLMVKWKLKYTRKLIFSLPIKVFGLKCRLNLTELSELSVYSKRGEKRETILTKNYYHSLDLKRIASMDLGKSHDYFIVFYISVKFMIVLDLEVKLDVECLTT